MLLNGAKVIDFSDAAAARLPPGYNRMRWKCKPPDRCFNVLMRPKIEEFADCFPGNINFGDVDSIVEIEGRGLVLDWKSGPFTVSDGQRILWTRLTKDRVLTAMFVAGNARTMIVTHSACFWGGKWGKWVPNTLAGVKDDFRRWTAWAQANSLL